VDGFDRPGPGATLDEPKRRAGSRFSDLGDRVTRALSKRDPVTASREPAGVSFPVYDQTEVYDDPVLPRFPITRQGYDCDVVDQHVAELEAELAALERHIDELRASARSREAVAVEIERIGEQTSAILVAAHDEAQQTLRVAELRAHTRIANAASYVSALTEEANLQLRKVEEDRRCVSRERARLIEDIRSTGMALSSLAVDAAQRFPPET
jgi:DivIVA protein